MLAQAFYIFNEEHILWGRSVAWYHLPLGINPHQRELDGDAELGTTGVRIVAVPPLNLNN